MHPVLGKIQFKSFDGLFDVHGTQREVAFVSSDDDGPSVLAIRGLTVEDALHVLSRLEGGLLKGKDAEQLPLPLAGSKGTNGVKQDAKTETKPEPKKETKPAPKAEAKKPEPEPEPEDADEGVKEDGADDDDLGDDVEAKLSPGDVSAMAKMEKLRPVIELMVSRGFKTAKLITEIAASIKDSVPALLEVEKKGNFEARIDRAAMVVLGHE